MKKISLLDIYKYYEYRVASYCYHVVETNPGKEEDLRKQLNESSLEPDVLRPLFLDKFTEEQLKEIDPKGELLEALAKTFYRDVAIEINNYLMFKNVWEQKLHD